MANRRRRWHDERRRRVGGGQCRDPRAQVITAAGEGSAAAIAINADLVEEDVRNAVLEFAGTHPTSGPTNELTDPQEELR